MSILLQMLRKRWRLSLLTFIMGCVAVGMSLLWNDCLSKIINGISASAAIPKAVTIFSGALILLNAGASFALRAVLGWTGETLTHDLRMGYARHCASLPLNQAEKLNTGQEISRLQNEIAEVSEYMRSSLFQLVNDCIKFLATFLWLLWLNPALTFISNLPVVFIMWYVIFSGKIIGDAVTKSQQANSIMNGFTDTLISIFPVIKVFDAARLLRGKHDNALNQWESLSVKAEGTRARLMSFSALLS